MKPRSEDTPTSRSYYDLFKILTRMSRAVHSGSSPLEIIREIVYHAGDFTRAKGAIFWIVNNTGRRIHAFVSHGFEYRSLAGVDYDTLMQIFDPDNQPRIFIEDARYDERIPDLERLGKKRVGSVTGINLKITRQFTGILAVYFTGHRQLDDQEMELVNALGEHAAIALHRALSYDGEMLKILRQMVEGLVLAIEARDRETHGHSMRVARFSDLVARQMGLSSKEAQIIFHAGLLHDIGKIGLEDYILEHLGTLSGKQMDSVRQHPVIGAGIVAPLTFLSGLAPIIRHHHERYDGTGYPDRLRGEAIPVGARIVGACDVFETMISGRRHMKTLSLGKAMAAMKKKSGILYDPAVVQALFTVIRREPEAFGTDAESVARCVRQLGQNIEDMALDSLQNACLNHPICF